MIHIDQHTNHNHRLFGLNGLGVSFNCARCGGLVSNRLPVRRGLTGAWFCSFRCAVKGRSMEYKKIRKLTWEMIDPVTLEQDLTVWFEDSDEPFSFREFSGKSRGFLDKIIAQIALWNHPIPKFLLK